MGVIHKATEGTNYVDAKYFTHRTAAQAAGLWWGAYHFATGDDANEQAEYFLSIVKPGPNDLIVLDFEQNPAGRQHDPSRGRTVRRPRPTDHGALARLLFRLLHQATARRKPQRHARQLLVLALRIRPRLPTSPPTGPTWTLWQYTDGQIGPEPHSVPGVGNCDRDQFNGDLDGLTRLWGYATGPASQPDASSTDSASD